MNTECIKLKDDCYLTIAEDGKSRIIKGKNIIDTDLERKINLENLIEEKEQEIEDINNRLEYVYPYLAKFRDNNYKLGLGLLFAITVSLGTISYLFLNWLMLIAAPFIIVSAISMKVITDISMEVIEEDKSYDESLLKDTSELLGVLKRSLSYINEDLLERDISSCSIPVIKRDNELEIDNNVKVKKLTH